MQYLLPCPCGHSIPISRSQAGMTVSCPQCNSTIEIPTIRGMANLTPAYADGQNDSSRNQTDGRSTAKRPSTQTTKSTLRKALAAVFFIVLVVAGLTTARWGIIRYATPTPFTVEDEIKQGTETLSQFSPAETWDAWQYYQSVGFREKNPAPYYRVKRVMELQDENMRLGAIVTAVAFACLMATLFVGKRSA